MLVMGNEAIALGAISAGVNLVSGYPGTPSTEVLETIAKNKDKCNGDLYVEWSVNEKCALEVAAGAAYTGAYSMVTMKQVGLNVASDPLMSLAYIGVKGAMVIVVADDPGPISSQTEQDTRNFAQFCKLPLFDPSSPEEAYTMIGDAFAYSHKYQTPVLFRPTTRVCHGCATIDVTAPRKLVDIEGFTKDSKWVIFPQLTYNNHIKIEARQVALSDDFSAYPFNKLEGSGRLGVATGGVSYAYVREACDILGVTPTTLKVATPHPFPDKLALDFLSRVDEVIVIEELDPVIERQLVYLCGKHGLHVNVRGKLDHTVQNAGENTVLAVTAALTEFLSVNYTPAPPITLPKLPQRPPVLCAGCPHRASFYAVKLAMKGKKAVFSGDIGCYTLGNAAPLNMVDTCLCMGAGVTVAQGLQRIEPQTANFAFIGDSTFFHSGITGVINAVYNQTNITLIVLDNKTTAMTGHQPHPGLGNTMMDTVSSKIDIAAVLTAVGVTSVQTVNPFEHDDAVLAVKEAADIVGVSAIIFKAPCISVDTPSPCHVVNPDKCVGCKRCINELGCPAISFDGTKAVIDRGVCFGCTSCVFVCPFGAINVEEKGLN